MFSLPVGFSEHPLVIGPEVSCGLLPCKREVSCGWSICKMRRGKSVKAATIFSNDLAGLASLQTSFPGKSLPLPGLQASSLGCKMREKEVVIVTSA